MLQNKIYQNYLKEIIRTFFIIIFGLSLIALTVSAINERPRIIKKNVLRISKK